VTGRPEAVLATRPCGRGVDELVAARAARAPDAVALSWRGAHLTYRALDEHANGLAHRLRALGVGPDVTVAIFAERSLEMVIGQLATLKAGGAFIPLDVEHPLERIADILDDARPVAVLTQTWLADRLPSTWAHVIDLDAAAAPRRDPPPSTTSLDHLAYVIYTSGSTGRPKAVMIPHRGLLNLIAWHARAFEVSEADRATQLAATAFDASVWELWPYLARGASVTLVEPDLVRAPARLRDWLVARDITLAFLPTPLAEAMFRLSWPASLALRRVLTGGDTLHAWPAPLPFEVVNDYGPTETSVVATWTPVTPDPGGVRPPIGRPIDGSRVHVADGDRRLAAPGAPGELLIGGEGVARGYLGQPGATGDRFVPDPFSGIPGARLYRSGDRVRLRADGQLEYLGRLDSQVKIRGFRVELGEIESELARHPSVSQAAAVVSGDDRLVAYVVPANADACDAAELRRFAASRLPPYMRPSAWVTVSALPLTPNGKVDRVALTRCIERDGEGRAGAAPAPPADDERLVGVWTSVLAIPMGRVADDLDMREVEGWDSLKHMELIAALEETFQREFTVDEIVAMRSLRAIKRIVAGRSASG
jgi:amino acid adenylation domain-containing protein